MPPNNRIWSCKPWLLVAMCLLAVPAGAQSRPTDALSWLSGCWESRRANGSIEEQWSSPKGGVLLGTGRTIRGDAVVEYEFVRIYSVGDTLVYDAHPSGQAPAEFRATPPYADAITFSNPTHDFPRRVIYTRVGSDSLVARVEGLRGGQIRGIDFRYQRVDCAKPASTR